MIDHGWRKATTNFQTRNDREERLLGIMWEIRSVDTYEARTFRESICGGESGYEEKIRWGWRWWGVELRRASRPVGRRPPGFAALV
jgi:hypothetical protein